MRVVVEEEALEAGLVRGLQDAVQVAGGHRVAAVRHAAGVDPGQNFLRVADSGQCAARFLLYYLVEKSLREA